MTTPLGRGQAPGGFRRMVPTQVAFLALRREPEGALTELASRHAKAGFSVVGYHYAIDQHGTILAGRSEHRPAALEGDNNEATVAIALLAPTTDAQDMACLTLLRSLQEKFPNATIGWPAAA